MPKIAVAIPPGAKTEGFDADPFHAGQIPAAVAQRTVKVREIQ